MAGVSPSTTLKSSHSVLLPEASVTAMAIFPVNSAGQVFGGHLRRVRRILSLRYLEQVKEMILLFDGDFVEALQQILIGTR